MNKLFVILLLFFTINTFASVGKVLFVKGDVSLLRNNKTLSLIKDQEIEKKDLVQTSKNGLVILQISNFAKVKINESSKYQVVSQTAHKIKEGSGFFNVLSKKLSENTKGKSRFKVKAGTAVMGVRGTSFFVAHGEKKHIWMCVQKGKVEIKGKKDKKTTLVKTGEGVKVTKGEKTSSPKPLKWTKNLNWNFDPNKGEVKNKVKIEDAYLELENLDYD